MRRMLRFWFMVVVAAALIVFAGGCPSLFRVCSAGHPCDARPAEWKAAERAQTEPVKLADGTLIFTWTGTGLTRAIVKDGKAVWITEDANAEEPAAVTLDLAAAEELSAAIRVALQAPGDVLVLRVPRPAAQRIAASFALGAGGVPAYGPAGAAETGKQSAIGASGDSDIQLRERDKRALIMCQTLRDCWTLQKPPDK